MQTKENLFTRRDTRCVKGIAALMMMAHHIFGFTDRLPLGYSYNLRILDMQCLIDLSISLRLCVALFMFLGGYGLCKQCESGKGSLIKSILRQYTQYWKVFLVFVPIGLCLFTGQGDYCADANICHAYDNFQLRQFISNLIGWTSEYNREWWFFKAYLCASFLGYVYLQLIRKREGGFWKEVLLVVIASGIWPEFWESVTHVETFTRMRGNLLFSTIIVPDRSVYCFLMGIVFARYDVIQKVREALSGIRRFVRLIMSVAGLVLILIARTYLFAEYLDIFLAPLVTIGIVEFCSAMPTRGKVLGFIGKYSADIWLIHGFYCYYFYGVVKLVFVTSEPVITFVILTGVTLLSSMILEVLYKGLRFIVKRSGLLMQPGEQMEKTQPML